MKTARSKPIKPRTNRAKTLKTMEKKKQNAKTEGRIGNNDAIRPKKSKTVLQGGEVVDVLH
jgi:hypothetical protein